tara:strand:- start:272 stop:502 length:231 start_codon:yes stop_codon:yes gene_type:complete
MNVECVEEPDLLKALVTVTVTSQTTVVFVEEIIVLVQTVLVLQTAIQLPMNVVLVITIQPMTVYKIVTAIGVVLLN